MESIPLLLFSRSFMSRWIWGLSVIAVSLRTGRQLVVSRIKFKFVHKSKTEELCSSEWSRDSPPSLLMVEWIQKQTITVAGNFMGCCLCGGRESFSGSSEEEGGQEKVTGSGTWRQLLTMCTGKRVAEEQKQSSQYRL